MKNSIHYNSNSDSGFCTKLRVFLFLCVFIFIYIFDVRTFTIYTDIACVSFVLIFLSLIDFWDSEETQGYSVININKNGILRKSKNYKFYVKFEQIEEILMFEKENSLKANCWLFIQEKTGKVRPIDLYFSNPNIQELTETLRHLTSLHSTKFSITKSKNDVNRFLQQELKHNKMQKNDIVEDRANKELEKEATNTSSNKEHLVDYTFYQRSQSNSKESYKAKSTSIDVGIMLACASVLIFDYGFLRFTPGLTMVGILVILLPTSPFLFISFWLLKVACTAFSPYYSIVLTNTSLIIEGNKYTWHDFESIEASGNNPKGVLLASINIGGKRLGEYENFHELTEQFTYYSRTFIDMSGKR